MALDAARTDEMSTDLALQSEDYDPSPSAEYESWLLLSRRCAWLSSREYRVGENRLVGSGVCVHCFLFAF